MRTIHDFYPWVQKQISEELKLKIDNVPQPPGTFASLLDENHVMWPIGTRNGLCSVMDCFAHDIIHVAKWCVENNLPCPRINWSNALLTYGKETYNKLFKPANEISLESYAALDPPNITSTGTGIKPEEIKVLRYIANDWFKPQDEIICTKNRYKEQYKFTPDKAVCVYYRGNDKIIETSQPSYISYGKYVKKTKEAHPEIDDFLIQSDDLEFQKRIIKPFKNTVIIQQLNHGLNLTNRLTGNHHTGSLERREVHVKHFYAALLLMAECKHILIPCTNASRWICALNDTERNITQMITYTQPNRLML